MRVVKEGRLNALVDVDDDDRLSGPKLLDFSNVNRHFDNTQRNMQSSAKFAAWNRI